MLAAQEEKKTFSKPARPGKPGGARSPAGKFDMSARPGQA